MQQHRQISREKNNWIAFLQAAQEPRAYLGELSSLACIYSHHQNRPGLHWMTPLTRTHSEGAECNTTMPSFRSPRTSVR